MDSCSRVFVRILTVLLIHEVVFCGCNSLKIETPIRAIKSNTDEYQRKERQAPIDPSRMYLPPKIDAVASSGFGGQVDASNNFGDNVNGYGEIGLVQDTTYNKGPSAEDSSYDVSTKAANFLEGGGQTTVGSYDTGSTSGSGGSSPDQSTSYNIFAPEGNNFGQIPNKNNGGDTSSPGASNYGSSLDTKSTPSNTDVAAQTSRANGHGQDELLNTAQSQGIVRNNHNELAEDRKFGQTPGVDKQYDRGAVGGNAASGYDDSIASSLSKTALQDSSRNGGQNVYDRQGNNGIIGFSENTRFSGNDGYGNTAPNSFDQKPTSGDYSSSGNTGYSYERPSIEFPGFSSLSPNFNNRNNPGKSAPPINNENYGSTWSTQSSRLGEYNQREASASKYGQFSNDRLNQGASASTQSRENDFNGKPNTGCYSQNLKNTNPPSGELSGQLLPNNNNNRFEQNPVNLCNQKPAEINGNKIGSTPFASSQGPSSVASNNGLQAGLSDNSHGSREYGKFDQKGSLNYEKEFNSNQQQSVPGESNNYGRPGSDWSRSGGNYAENGLANNEHGNRGGSSNGFGQQNRQPSDNYGQTGPATREPNDRGSAAGPQSVSSVGGDYGGNGGNSPANNGGGHAQGNSPRPHGIDDAGGQVPPGAYNDRPLDRNSYAQTYAASRNGVHAAATGRGGGPDTLPNRHPTTNGICATVCRTRAGQSVVSDPAASAASGNRNQKKYSTLVPKGRYQNSNLPSRGVVAGRPGESYPNSVNDNGKPVLNVFSNFTPVDQPGPPNSFSNFAPGNPPPANRPPPPPPIGNDQPAANAFSNFAPGNLPDSPPPPAFDNGEPGANAFSNFAPGNSPPDRPPPTDDVRPGPNSFSNFAPGNLPDLLPPAFDNGEPGANAFSSFAPGNPPNRPPPVSTANNPGSGNNCGKSHGDGANRRTAEGVFPNVGY